MVAISVEVCMCLSVHVFVLGIRSLICLNRYSLVMGGGGWCTVITNMICACTEHCCTWLICCTTCLCRDSFVCFFCTVRCWIAKLGSKWTDAERDGGCCFFKAQVLSLTSHTTHSFFFFFLDIGRATTISHFSHVFLFCWHGGREKREKKISESCIYWLPVLKWQRQSNYNWLIIFSEPNTPFNTVIWMLRKNSSCELFWEFP